MKTFEQAIKSQKRCTICGSTNPCVRASAIENQGSFDEREVIAVICQKCFDFPLVDLVPIDYDTIMEAQERKKASVGR